LVTHAALVNPQYPSRALAGQPIGRTLDNPARHQIIALAPVIRVLIESGDDHPCLKANFSPTFVSAAIAVRQTEKFSEQAIEVSA